MTLNYKISSIIAFYLVCSSYRINAQNTPVLSQTAPANSVSVINIPQEVNVNQPLNFVDYLVPSVPATDTLFLNTQTPGQVEKTRTFRDGFDRTYQSIQFNAVVTSTNQTKDIIRVADNRPQQNGYSFLPFSRDAYSGTGNGAATSAFNEQKAYYNSVYPGEGYTSYSKRRYLSDAGMRQSQDYSPGKSQVGQARMVGDKKIVNYKNEVRVWHLNASGMPVSNGYYPPNTLYGDSLTNQDGVPVIMFYDKNNRLIAKAIADSFYLKYVGDVGIPNFGFQATYYVYDDLGLLRYTLTPKAVQASGSTISTGVLNNLCFQFKYDSRGRLSQKRKPGESAFTEFVYDRNQRIVMRRTPKEQSANKWEITFYDKRGRVIATSLYSSSLSRDACQDFFDQYAGASYPVNDIRYYLLTDAGGGQYPPESGISGNVMMSYLCYDDYSLSDPSKALYNSLISRLSFTQFLTIPGAEVPYRGINTQGLLTGEKIRILPAPGVDTGSTGAWRQSAIYYDNKGRAIYKSSFDLFHNDTVHLDYVGVQYDFRNRAILTKHMLINQNSHDGNNTHTELTQNTYQSTTGLLQETDHKLDNGTWNILAIYKYDDLGRVNQQVLGDYGEVRDYNYNIRGQLAGINGHYAENGDKQGESRSFGESLKYDYGFTKPRYDGKISGMVWRGSGGAQDKALAYGYAYDPAGRLTTADFREGQDQNGQYITSSTWDKDTMDYSVSNITYDKNGNILSKDMRGPGFTANNVPTPSNIDQLTYSYAANSNQLSSVSDAISQNYGDGDFQNGNTSGNDYAYDEDGNLTTDMNKGITDATYTLFDKPQFIQLPNGASVRYSYTAAGNKVQEQVISDSVNKITDYIGNFVYQNDSVQYASTGVGRTVWNMDTTKEEFFVKDHLGNVRSIIDVYHYPILQYLTTYEIASAQLEEMYFDDVDSIRTDKPGSTDPGDTKAGKLNGADPNERTGTSILLKVMAGDKVEMNVDNYYDGTYNSEDDQPITAENMLSSIITTLTTGTGGLGSSESHNPSLVPRLFNSENYTEADQLMHQSADPRSPKAFLNYVLFDEHMQVVRTFTGAWQVNGNGGWQTIGTDEPMTIPVNGFLAVYVSNASNFSQCSHCNITEGDVFFDKLKIKFTRGNLKEENHYYPYGLPMAAIGSSAMGMTLNRQKYQSNEYITEAGLNWMSFGARQYDPQIGRFLSVDPLAGYGDQDRFSPYAAMGDEPVDRVDPFGYIDTINLGGYHIPEVQVTAERLVYVTAPDPIGMEDFNAFWGAISAGGYWGTDYGGGGPSFGNTRPLGPQPNSSGTLQTLSQSIDHNSGKSPDVATNSDGKEGYNSNYQGKTGDDRGNSVSDAADAADKVLVGAKAAAQGLADVPAVEALGTLATGIVAGHQIYQGIKNHDYIQLAEGVGAVAIEIFFPEAALAYAIITVGIDYYRHNY